PLTWPLLPFPWSAHVQGVRMLWAVALGLLAGVAATRVARRRGSPRIEPAGRGASGHLTRHDRAQSV
ncbi:MAG: hypothetical protein IRY92_11880, partial [Dactylosporangium sp.]|nr:hypothetical protein [Dactylosporangium sp.]